MDLIFMHEKKEEVKYKCKNQKLSKFKKKQTSRNCKMEKNKNGIGKYNEQNV